jgi:phosphatidylinositol glycan class H protein
LGLDAFHSSTWSLIANFTSYDKTRGLKACAIKGKETMLLVKRPTSTTVQYTVSTRPPKKTLPAHIATYLFILLRILTGFLVATVLLLDYRSSEPASSNAGTLAWLENAILTSPSTQFASLLIDSIGRIYRLLICAGLTWLIFRKGYTEESLLAIRGLGVQTSTSSPSYLWTSSTRFIPTSNIQDIFIHEAFKGFEVRFYLSIVVEGEEDVVVVFPVRWPDRIV